LKKNNIDLINFHKSIGDELNVIRDRVRHLIGDAHWGEEGRYKEAILRNSISKFLPNQYSLGTGFVLIKDVEQAIVTSQIDIIVYDNSYPTLFKEGDFVIVLPQSVRGIIEVKTKINTVTNFAKAVKKINVNSKLIYKKQKESEDVNKTETPLRKFDKRLFIGLFSYDFNGKKEEYLTKLENIFSKENNIELNLEDKCRYFVNHISLSDEVFLNFFPNPYGDIEYTGWKVTGGLSKAFFITQLLWYLEPFSVSEEARIWTAPIKLRTFKRIVLKKGQCNSEP